MLPTASVDRCSMFLPRSCGLPQDCSIHENDFQWSMLWRRSVCTGTNDVATTNAQGSLSNVIKRHRKHSLRSRPGHTMLCPQKTWKCVRGPRVNPGVFLDFLLGSQSKIRNEQRADPLNHMRWSMSARHLLGPNPLRGYTVSLRVLVENWQGC